MHGKQLITFPHSVCICFKLSRFKRLLFTLSIMFHVSHVPSKLYVSSPLVYRPDFQVLVHFCVLLLCRFVLLFSAQFLNFILFFSTVFSFNDLIFYLDHTIDPSLLSCFKISRIINYHHFLLNKLRFVKRVTDQHFTP